jgi:23S rRNA (uracil1939-C5)-methyltransferase
LPTEETVNIEKLVYGGEGLARLDGRVVLVPYVAPGETVRVDVQQVKKDLFRGRLLEVMSSSPSRVSPDCPYFPRCGGCQYQHLDSATQLDQKRAILREVLRRVGKIECGEIGTIAGEPWHYRNRVQVHIDRGQVGYFEHGSRRLCAIDHCPIASPVLNQAISTIHSHLPQLGPFTSAVELFTNETEVQVNVLDRVPRAVLSTLQSVGTSMPIEYAGFQVSRNSFFQVNRFLVDDLVTCAIEDHQGASALDLYAGVGLFSTRLAERFTSVAAVEASQSAFRDLEHNLKDRVAAEHTTAEEYLARLETRPDFILADPPRTGLAKQVIQELTRIQAPALAIVSCDPATLARDLQGLVAGGYRFARITLVDLFPQTAHLETVVQLER